MQAELLLAGYSVLVLVASLLGGWVPLVVRLTHRRMQLAGSLVAGVMLGIGVLHMLPHAAAATGSFDRVAAWMLAGILAMFFVQRFFEFHHHDVDDEPDDRSEIHSGHPHGHEHCSVGSHAAVDLETSGQGTGGRGWIGAATGLMLHGMTDGLALAAAVETESRTGIGPWAGIATFLVIFLHKPFDALTLGTMLAIDRQDRARRQAVNVLFALAVPLGAILFYQGFGREQGVSNEVVGSALAFAAGTFVCIALADLLPEMQFHHHDRVALSSALMAGLAVAWGIGLLEGPEHGHGHGHEPRHDSGEAAATHATQEPHGHAHESAREAEHDHAGEHE